MLENIASPPAHNDALCCVWKSYILLPCQFLSVGGASSAQCASIDDTVPFQSNFIRNMFYDLVLVHTTVLS